MKTTWTLIKLDAVQLVLPVVAMIVSMLFVVFWFEIHPASPWPPVLATMSFLGFSSLLGALVLEGGSSWTGDTLPGRMPISLLTRLLVRLLVALFFWGVMALCVLAVVTRSQVSFNYTNALIMAGGIALLSGITVSFFLTGFTAAMAALVTAGTMIGFARSIKFFLLEFVVSGNWEFKTLVSFPHPISDNLLAGAILGVLFLLVLGLLIYGVRRRPDAVGWRQLLTLIIAGVLLLIIVFIVLMFQSDMEYSCKLRRDAVKCAAKLNALPPEAFRVPATHLPFLEKFRDIDKNGWNVLRWVDSDNLAPSLLTREQFQSLIRAGRCRRFIFPTGFKDATIFPGEEIPPGLSWEILWMGHDLEHMLNDGSISIANRMVALKSWASLRDHLLKGKFGVETATVSDTMIMSIQAFRQVCVDTGNITDVNDVSAIEKFCSAMRPRSAFRKAWLYAIACTRHAAGFPALKRAAKLAGPVFRDWILYRIQSDAAFDVRYLKDAKGRKKLIQYIKSIPQDPSEREGKIKDVLTPSFP